MPTTTRLGIVVSNSHYQDKRSKPSKSKLDADVAVANFLLNVQCGECILTAFHFDLSEGASSPILKVAFASIASLVVARFPQR